ncbi:MAG: cache domain-containing protein [Holophagaceae bacterium]|uniref:Cache domain-containing protein n=1 Tax=Candidatus Geothrix skivensis TaxID=2954439 RepID=A0A9D7XJX1_9BACT|nr:cache domain-containing protein [Candidatus Geothrix skivensis]
MRRTFSTLLCLPALCLTLAAQDATPAETETLVKSAIAFAKANGKDAAIKEITRAGGKFHGHGGELYVFIYDMDGKVIAHGQGAGKIGVNQMNAKDPDGVEFVKDRIKLAKTKGKGWHDYQYVNPTTMKRQPKTSYIEVWDNLIFGAGIYKK